MRPTIERHLWWKVSRPVEAGVDKVLIDAINKENISCISILAVRRET